MSTPATQEAEQPGESKLNDAAAKALAASMTSVLTPILEAADTDSPPLSLLGSKKAKVANMLVPGRVKRFMVKKAISIMGLPKELGKTLAAHASKFAKIAVASTPEGREKAMAELLASVPVKDVMILKDAFEQAQKDGMIQVPPEVKPFEDALSAISKDLDSTTMDLLTTAINKMDPEKLQELSEQSLKGEPENFFKELHSQLNTILLNNEAEPAAINKLRGHIDGVAAVTKDAKEQFSIGDQQPGGMLKDFCPEPEGLANAVPQVDSQTPSFDVSERMQVFESIAPDSNEMTATAALTAGVGGQTTLQHDSQTQQARQTQQELAELQAKALVSKEPAPPPTRNALR